MNLGMTKMQEATLTFVSNYLATHNGVSPSYDEIKDALGLRSKSGVCRLVNALAQRGHITRRRERARSICVGPDYRALLQTLAEKVNSDASAASAMARDVLDHFRSTAQ